VSYEVSITHRVEREIARLHPRIRRQITGKIIALEDNPRPQDIKAIKGRENTYRVDSGEYRILFQLDDQAKLVTIFRVGHRKDVYRGL